MPRADAIPAIHKRLELIGLLNIQAQRLGGSQQCAPGTELQVPRLQVRIAGASEWVSAQQGMGLALVRSDWFAAAVPLFGKNHPPGDALLMSSRLASSGRSHMQAGEERSEKQLAPEAAKMLPKDEGITR